MMAISPLYKESLHSRWLLIARSFSPNDFIAENPALPNKLHYHASCSTIKLQHHQATAPCNLQHHKKKKRWSANMQITGQKKSEQEKFHRKIFVLCQTEQGVSFIAKT